jgi:bifunctional DNA-binding transcriptional regulator/antitoxin component of YhaV-PrlF toxin-antitoxin module
MSVTKIVTIPAVKIMKEGRITIDKEIRVAYGIAVGSMWKVTLEEIEPSSKNR